MTNQPFEFLKGIWKDPVWSKVISVFIVFLISWSFNKFIQYNKFITYSLVLAVYILLTAMFFYIINFSKYFFRETYAFLSLFYIFFIFILLIFSVLIKKLPWNIFISMYPPILDKEIDNGILTSDYLFLLLLGFVHILLIHNRYRKWSGIISSSQYYDEQNGRRSSILADSIVKMKLLIKGRRLVEREYEIIEKPDIAPIVDINLLSWPLQVRDLVILFSSAYEFNISDGWHDNERCWIGINKRNNSLVALLPLYDVSANLDYQLVVEYARNVASLHQREFKELIVVGKQRIDLLDPDIAGVKIRLFSEETLLNQIGNFSDYQFDVKRRVEDVSLIESTYTIKDVYVTPRVNIVGEEEGIIDLEQYIRQWLKENTRRHLAILGDYGQGKSTAALMLSYKMFEEAEGIPSRIPILIELRGKHLRDQEPVDILGLWGGRYGISGKSLLRLHEAGRLLLIFEGFDEMAQLSDYDTRSRYFKAIWAFSAFPMSKIIITGRPNLFESTNELNAALGIPVSRINSHSIGAPRCQAIKLLSFGVDQISEALRMLPKQVQLQIIERTSSEPRFLEIVSRPSLLHVVSSLWEQNQLHLKALSSASVIGMFVYNSYNRQISKEKTEFQFSGLTSIERAYFMSGIATYMSSKELTSISNSNLKEIVYELLNNMPDKLPMRSHTLRVETQVHLRERLKDQKGLYDRRHLEQLFTDVRSSGLLVVDSATNDSFKFGHKSFMEYLFAEVIASNILDTDQTVTNSILRSSGAEFSDIGRQKVTSLFLAELITENSSLNVDDKLGIQEKEQLIIHRFYESIFKLDEVEIVRHKRLTHILIFVRAIGLQRPTIYMILSQLYPVALVFIALLIILESSFTLRDESLSVILSFSASFFVYIFLLSIPNYIGIFFDRLQTYKTSRLRIWLLICHYSGISDESVLKFFKLDTVLWLNKKPFIYFYNDHELKLYRDKASLLNEPISKLAKMILIDSLSVSTEIVERFIVPQFYRLTRFMLRSGRPEYSVKPDVLLIRHVEKSIKTDQEVIEVMKEES